MAIATAAGMAMAMFAALALAASPDAGTPAPAPAPAPAGPAANPYAALLAQEGESLTQVCGTKCHQINMVLDQPPRSYDAWHDTVQKMLDRGAVASDEQLLDIMDYLHQTLTKIDVNGVDADELQIVLNVSDTQATAILARRALRKFVDLADLKSVAGLDSAALDAKAKFVVFQ